MTGSLGEESICCDEFVQDLSRLHQPGLVGVEGKGEALEGRVRVEEGQVELEGLEEGQFDFRDEAWLAVGNLEGKV